MHRMTNDHNFVLAVAAASSAVTVVWRQRNEAVMLGERIDGLEVRQGYASGSWGGCPCHLSYIGWLLFRRPIPRKPLKFGFFLSETTLNKKTLVMHQICCQNFFVFHNVCSMNKSRNFRVRCHRSLSHLFSLFDLVHQTFSNHKFCLEGIVPWGNADEHLRTIL
jgi:hypothetical protein